MLARVGDALYWMGRYLERAENVTRLLLVTEDLSTELLGLHEELALAEWRDLLTVFPGAVAPEAPRAEVPAVALAHLRAFFNDPANPYAVAQCLRRARDNARAVREALTTEVFTNLNEAHRELEGRQRRELRDLPSARSALVSTQKALLSIVGAIDHTLTRNEGWRFLKLGETLERTFRSAFVLRAKLPALVAPARTLDVELRYTRWRGLLRAVSSLENYRQTEGGRLEPRDVIRFVLFDPHAPRALRHGVGAVKAYLERAGEANGGTPPDRLIGRLLARLAYDADQILQGEDVTAFLDHVLDELGKVHDALAAEYFTT